MYSISPYDICTTKTITSFRIDRIEISLFKSAIITVILLDAAGSIIDIKFINISGEDYSKWNADDNYVVEFIKQFLGFSDPVVEDLAVENEIVVEDVDESSLE